MSRQQSAETYPPLTDTELAAAEKRARKLPKAWPRPEPHRLFGSEREARRSRWEDLRVQLGWNSATPLTPEQKADLNTLIREKIQAHRREKRQQAERHAGGR
jgi:hypothetical protein